MKMLCLLVYNTPCKIGLAFQNSTPEHREVPTWLSSPIQTWRGPSCVRSWTPQSSCWTSSDTLLRKLTLGTPCPQGCRWDSAAPPGRSGLEGVLRASRLGLPAPRYPEGRSKNTSSDRCHLPDGLLSLGQRVAGEGREEPPKPTAWGQVPSSPGFPWNHCCSAGLTKCISVQRNSEE